MSLQEIPTVGPTQLVSPPVFYGYNKYSRKDYTFCDTRGVEHIVSNFEDAKIILFVTYTNLLKSCGIKIDDSVVENAIRKSSIGNYAYFSLKLR